MRRRLGLLALSSLAVLLSWEVAEGCTCAPEPSAAEALAVADAGFVGTIVDQRAILHIDGIYTGPAIEYDVVVQRAWKGVGERRLSLRRLSPCAPGFGVGETSLIYATRMHGALVVPSCLPTKRITDAARALVQLGEPVLTFPGHAQPVATSLSLSRWMRAHVVAGIGIYAFTYTQRDWISPTWDMFLLLAVAALLVGIAAVSFVRRRWRAGGAWLGATLLALAAHVLWTGHVFLRSDWSAPFLRW
jgi:hypothetical protein